VFYRTTPTKLTFHFFNFLHVGHGRGRENIIYTVHGTNAAMAGCHLAWDGVMSRENCCLFSPALQNCVYLSRKAQVLDGK
jgi:hypothetical protein